MPTAGASATGPAPVPSMTKAARSRRIHARIYPLDDEGPAGPRAGADRELRCLVVVRVVRDRRGGVRRIAAGGGGRVRGRRGGGRRAGGGCGLGGLDAVAPATATSVGHENLRCRGLTAVRHAACADVTVECTACRLSNV